MGVFETFFSSGGFGGFLTQGGPSMYVIVLAAVIGFVIVLLQFILAKRTVLWPLLAASITGTLLMGVGGTVFGMIEAYGALDQAAPDQRMAYIARGISMALHNAWLAIALAGILCFFGSIAVTVSVNRRKAAS